MQFMLCGISTIIGLENYQKLIIHDNKYLATRIATIPIDGITNKTLDLTIHVAHPTKANKHMSICRYYFPICGATTS